MQLNTALADLAGEWFAKLEGNSLSVAVFRACEEDPFRMTGAGQPARAFDASVGIQMEAGDAFAQFETQVAGLASKLKALVYADLSAVQLGSNRVFIESPPTPVRYQYCMRRRTDLTPEEYFQHYEEVHSQFGLKTQGIRGYTQLHLDAEFTKRGCESAGFGLWQYSSVSILQLDSVSEFLASGQANAETGFAEDEEKFVDRANSIMWTSDETFRLGP
ncbi:MAG: EthD domain-containing protein [Myxococcota bacterium]|nr:EthD domain-containing protein [Myxococcota bacterium]